MSDVVVGGLIGLGGVILGFALILQRRLIVDRSSRVQELRDRDSFDTTHVSFAVSLDFMGPLVLSVAVVLEDDDDDEQRVADGHDGFVLPTAPRDAGILRGEIPATR